MPKFLMGVEIMIDVELKEDATRVLKRILNTPAENDFAVPYEFEYRTTHQPILLKPDSAMAEQMEILGSSALHHPDTTGGVSAEEHKRRMHGDWVVGDPHNPEEPNEGYERSGIGRGLIEGVQEPKSRPDTTGERPGITHVLGMADHPFVISPLGSSCLQCHRPRSVHPTP